VLGAEKVTTESGKTQVQSFSETVKLLDYGFDNFSRQVILSTDEFIDEVPVALSQEVNSVKVHPAQEIERLVPVDLDPTTDIQRVITLNEESVDAPVEKGQVLGQITLRYGGTEYATVDLLADEDVTASPLLVFRRNVMDFLHRPVTKIAAFSIVAVVILGVVLRITLASRRREKRYGPGYTGTRSGGYKGRKR
jgi:D-alanyl-D-alanine carboxypeptidase (penicillin-binding protein 5/6)